MELTDELYDTMIHRDTRFDGKLYIGIVSTGIVCFPSCRSRLPKRANVRVFGTLESAVQAGFRPCKRCRPDHPQRTPPDTELVVRVMAILRADYGQPITLSSLARAVNVSPYHLQRVCKRCTGRSPAQELVTVRVEQAQKRLRDSTASIGDIARQVGFRSPSHFAVVFRRAVGVSPQAFRSEAGGGR